MLSFTLLRILQKVGRNVQTIVEETNLNNNHTNQKLLRPLCPTRWVMRLPAVDAFIIHYKSIVEFLESIKDDVYEPVKNRDEALSIYLGLSIFKITLTFELFKGYCNLFNLFIHNARGRKLLLAMLETG